MHSDCYGLEIEENIEKERLKCCNHVPFCRSKDKCNSLFRDELKDIMIR